MKTKVIMALMGIFFVLSNTSYANSFNKIPDCCKKQEACCVENATCCKGEEVSKSLNDCCEQNKECCETAKACCDKKVKTKKHSSNKKHIHGLNSKENKMACCN